MKTVFHAAQSRGVADHGWLKSHHTFSFAGYHDPNRVHFGALRVINDDEVAGGKGFEAHPHHNMEIISLPISGDLAHRDSMGHAGVIRSGDVQIMSAGTGVVHSEMNANADIPVQFLQIWVLPNQQAVEPRYAQQRWADVAQANDFQQIVSPREDDAGVWLHQQAWFSLARWQGRVEKTYTLHRPGNGVYVFVIDGQARVNDIPLAKRDGLGVWETDSFRLKVDVAAEILLMEVPMAV